MNERSKSIDDGTTVSMVVDLFEITNSIDSLRAKPKRKKKVLMPLLFDPEFIGKKKNEITGKVDMEYKLKNLDTIGIKYMVRPLHYGDYIISSLDEGGNPDVKIVERKTMADFLGSFTGFQGKGKIRIDEEIRKCIEGANRDYKNASVSLLIEDFYECNFDNSEDGLGVWIPTWKWYDSKKKDKKKRSYYKKVGYTRRNIHPNALLKKIESFEMKGVDVIRCLDAADAYKTLINMVMKGNDRKGERLRAVRRKPSSMDPQEELFFIMEGFQNTGPVLARSILEKYGTVGNFLVSLQSASCKDDIGVKGFGKKTFNYYKDVLSRNYEKKDA